MYKPLYLSKKYKKGERLLTKAMAKGNWYKGKAQLNQSESWKSKVPKEWRNKCLRQRTIEGVKLSTVMMVPNTSRGELIDKLIEKEAQLSRITGYMRNLLRVMVYNYRD